MHHPIHLGQTPIRRIWTTTNLTFAIGGILTMLYATYPDKPRKWKRWDRPLAIGGLVAAAIGTVGTVTQDVVEHVEQHGMPTFP